MGPTGTRGVGVVGARRLAFSSLDRYTVQLQASGS